MQYGHGDDDLEIRARSASMWSRSGRVTAHAVIAGHAATTTDESYERCLQWNDPPGLVRQICSVTSRARVLDENELEQIARSLY